MRQYKSSDSQPSSSKKLPRNYDPTYASGPVYKGSLSPEIPFDRDCTSCDLKCGKAVPGAGPADLSKVKLILISDYPGPYEAQWGWPQVPGAYARFQEDKIKKRSRRKRFPPKNSGEFIRQCVEDVLGLDPWEEVYYTNAVRCSPFRGKKTISINLKHLRPCVNQWLRQEFDALNVKAPNAPVIVGGTQALNAFNLLYGTKYPNVSSMRRVTTEVVDGRPIAFTYNPAMVSRGELALTTYMGTIKNVYQPLKTKPWDVLGTPQWHFKKDIDWLKPYLENHADNSDHT